MKAIDTWKAKLRSRRHGHGAESADKAHAWDDRRAAWFNRFATSDRTPTYNLFRQDVGGTVLEIGPGPGAYTRLLARDAQRIVAVEPSPAMVGLLQGNLANQNNVEIVASSIEDYLPSLGRYHFALAANVLAGIERLDEVLATVTAHSACLVIATWDVKEVPGWQVAVQQEVLHRQEAHSLGATNEDMLAVIGEIGLSYRTLYSGRHKFTFAQQEDLFGWVAGYLDVPAEALVDMRQAVMPHVEQCDGQWVLPSGRETMLLRLPAGNHS